MAVTTNLLRKKAGLLGLLLCMDTELEVVRGEDDLLRLCRGDDGSPVLSRRGRDAAALSAYLDGLLERLSLDQLAMVRDYLKLADLLLSLSRCLGNRFPEVARECDLIAASEWPDNYRILLEVLDSTEDGRSFTELLEGGPGALLGQWHRVVRARQEVLARIAQLHLRPRSVG